MPPGPDARDPHSTLAQELLTWSSLEYQQSPKMKGFGASPFLRMADPGSRWRMVQGEQCGEVKHDWHLILILTLAKVLWDLRGSSFPSASPLGDSALPCEMERLTPFVASNQ